MSKRLSLILLSLIAVVMSVSAQIMTPIKWKAEMKMTSPSEGEIVLNSTIEPGWHLYSWDFPSGQGPQPLDVAFDLNGAELVGGLVPSQKAVKQMDEIFEMELSWWTSAVTIRQKFKATEPKFNIGVKIRYGACNDQNCIPPSREEFSFEGEAKVSAPAPEKKEVKEEVSAPAAEIPADTAKALIADSAKVSLAMDSAKTVTDAELPGDIWAPVTFDGSDASSQNDIAGRSMLYIFLTCFVGGLVALFTPCVWPMIPMTVSFFLKKGKDRSRSIIDACIYGASIIIIYVALGLVITAIFGASSLNALSTSAVCNIIFFLLLVIFAASFFGAFEITLPASWSNRMDATAERTTGLLSIFFMAFTLTLVSFSCTGPIIGTLLVEAASMGSVWGPAIGMLGFSTALALPFMLFAMFPTMLQSAPKSGGWMNTLKVVLGFVELALSLKFLSVADLAYGWHILDREVFLALWIVMFGLLGLYLLGKFNFSHYGPADSSVGVFRFFLAMVSLSFMVYLIPGLWGAPLKGVSAFVPPLHTQDFNLYGTSFHEYDDFEEGMRAGAREGKPVLIDFSGHGCVNCRKMEGAVLDNEGVKTLIEDNFVVIKLMVDEKKELPEPMTVTENGKTVTLDTYGDKWSYLQRSKFNANAQPYYVVLDDKGQLISGPFSYDESIPRFTSFLEKGLGK